MRACIAWKLAKISTPSLSLSCLISTLIRFSFPMFPLHITFWFSRFYSHQCFFLLTFSICYVKSSKLVTFTTLYVLMSPSLIPNPRFPSEILTDISIIRMVTSMKNSKCVPVKLIIITLLYLKSLFSPLLLTSLNCNPPTKFLKPESYLLSSFFVLQSWHQNCR